MQLRITSFAEALSFNVVLNITLQNMLTCLEQSLLVSEEYASVRHIFRCRPSENGIKWQRNNDAHPKRYSKTLCCSSLLALCFHSPPMPTGLLSSPPALQARAAGQARPSCCEKKTHKTGVRRKTSGKLQIHCSLLFRVLSLPLF